MASSATQSPQPPPPPSSGPGSGPGSASGTSRDPSTSNHAMSLTPVPSGFQFHRHASGSFPLPLPNNLSSRRKHVSTAPTTPGFGSLTGNPTAAEGSPGFTFHSSFTPSKLLPSNKRTSNPTPTSTSSPCPPANVMSHQRTSFSFGPPTLAQAQHDIQSPPTPSHPTCSSSSTAAQQHRPKTPSIIFNPRPLRSLTNSHQQPTWTTRRTSSDSNQQQSNTLQIHAPRPINASTAPTNGFVAGFNLAGYGVRQPSDHDEQQGSVKYARREDDGLGCNTEMRDQDDDQHHEQAAYNQQHRPASMALVGGMLTPMTPIPEEDGSDHHMHMSSGDTGFYSSEDSAPAPRPHTATARPPSRDPSAAANHIARPAKRPRTASGTSPTTSSSSLDMAADIQESIARIAAENQQTKNQLAAANHELGVLGHQLDQARAAAEAAARHRMQERDEWMREREQAAAEMQRIKKDADTQVGELDQRVRELREKVQAGAAVEQELRDQVQAACATEQGLREQVRASVAVEQELRQEVQARVAVEQELRAQVEHAVNERHVKERAVQELTQRNADLVAESTAMLAEVNKVKAQVDLLAHVEEFIGPKVDTVLTATQSVDGKLSELEAAVHSGTNQTSELVDKVDCVHDCVRRLLTGVDGVVPAITDRLVQLERITTDLAPTIQADSAAAAGALGDQLRTVHADVLAVARSVTDQLAGEKAQCAQAQVDLITVQQEKAQLEVRLAELTGMVDSAGAQVETVRNEFQARIDELVRAREAADEQVQLARARADMASFKAEKAEQEKASAMAGLAQLRDLHAAEVSEFEAKVREREVRIKEVEGQAEVLQEQIKQMESDLAISQQLKEAFANITSLLTTLDQAKEALYTATAAESHNRLSEVEQRISHTLEQLGSAHSEETRRLQVFFGERDAGMDEIRRREGVAFQQQVKSMEERLAGIHDEVANAVVTRILDKCVTQNLVFVDPNRPAPPAASAAPGSMAPASTNPAQFAAMFQAAPIPLPPPPMAFGAAGAASGGDDDGMVIDVVSSSVEQSQSQSQQPAQSQDQTDEGSLILRSPTPPMPATPSVASSGRGGVSGLRARSRVTFAMDAAVLDTTQMHSGSSHKRPRSPSPDVPLPMSPPPTVQRKSATASSAKSSAASNSRLVRQGIFTQRVESGDSTTTNESASIAGSANSLLMSPQMLTSPVTSSAAAIEQHQQIQDPFAFVEGPGTSELSSPSMADVKTEPAEPAARKLPKPALVTPIRRAKPATTTPAETTAVHGAAASRTKRRVTINAPPSPAMPVEEDDEILGTTRGSRSSRSVAASAGARGKLGSASGTRSRPGSRSSGARR